MAEEQNKDQEIALSLLKWYQEAKRDLPWRQTRDPYAIWVSEVMLQQTQVATVIPYYKRWLQRFPTLQSLAEANEEEVLRYWSGLGYYKRARNLHRAAQQILWKYHGQIPADKEALLRLPGVGEYTAGALLSLAFNQPVPLIDGNVERVLCRLYGRCGNPKRSPLRKELRQKAGKLVTLGPPAELNSALMELGATICTPRNPLCHSCPLQKHCQAFALNLQEQIPQTPASPKAQLFYRSAAVVYQEEAIAVVRIPLDQVWGGLWALPQVDLQPGEPPEEGAIRAAQEWLDLPVRVKGLRGTLRHTITYRRILLFAFDCLPLGDRVAETLPKYEADLSETGIEATVRWVKTSEIQNLALPAPHRKLLSSFNAYQKSPFPTLLGDLSF